VEVIIMAMSREGKQSLSAAMKREADATQCPVCERRSALVMRLVGERHRTWCQWIERGLCESVSGVNDTRPL
jgi:hypothetical protein